MNHARRSSEAGTITPRSAVPPPQRHRTGFARLVGAAGMVALTGALFWLLTDDSFSVTEASVSFEGLQHADETAVRERLSGLERSPNVFRVRASDIVAEMSLLTEVDAASASVTLPASVSVRLVERDPVFVWSNGNVAWLVDEDGMLFAPAMPPADAEVAGEERAAEETTSDAQGAADEPAVEGFAPEAATTVAQRDVARTGLPRVEDHRIVTEVAAVGSNLPAGDLDVMRQLLAITPELVGGASTRLELRVDQNLGYELKSDMGWTAVFGHYTPTLQPPDVIPAQVQCLAALLAKEEKKLVRVRLVVSDTGCGTYTTHE